MCSLWKAQNVKLCSIHKANMLYALAVQEPNIGTVRECFAANQLAFAHLVEYGKHHGDFMIDGKYTFEVGGADSPVFGLPATVHMADSACIESACRPLLLSMLLIPSGRNGMGCSLPVMQ